MNLLRLEELDRDPSANPSSDVRFSGTCDVIGSIARDAGCDGASRNDLTDNERRDNERHEWTHFSSKDLFYFRIFSALENFFQLGSNFIFQVALSTKKDCPSFFSTSLARFFRLQLKVFISRIAAGMGPDF